MREEDRVQALLKEKINWRKMVDPNGHRFYYNVQTQESTHIRPGTGSFGVMQEWTRGLQR